MPLDSVVPVRLEKSMKLRLSAVAAKARLKTSDLIRRAIEDMVMDAEETGEINLSLKDRSLPNSRNPRPRPPKKPVNY